MSDFARTRLKDASARPRRRVKASVNPLDKIIGLIHDGGLTQSIDEDLYPPHSSLSEYNYPCEYCDGTVKPRTVERESFKHKHGFIILEDVTIGVCDRCGNRYYTADILRAVDELASGKRAPERTEAVPVGHLTSVH